MSARYVVGFLFDRPGLNVVLLRKVKPAWQRDRWNGLGGHIEAGETPAEAMRREFQEEAGLDVAEWEQFALLRGEGFELHCFTARAADIWQCGGMTTEGLVQVHRVEALPATALANVNWLVPMALHSTATNGMPFQIQEHVTGA